MFFWYSYVKKNGITKTFRLLIKVVLILKRYSIVKFLNKEITCICKKTLINKYSFYLVNDEKPSTIIAKIKQHPQILK